MRRQIGFWLALVLILLAGGACADALALQCQIGNNAGAVIRTVDVNGEFCLFLPSCARSEPITLLAGADDALTIEGRAGQPLPLASGEPFRFSALLADEPDDGKYSLTVQNENGKRERVTLMISQNIRSLFLSSTDPTAHDRLWLEDCDDHERSTTGSAVLLRADGSETYSGELSEIRGRGNSTWWYKPSFASARQGDYKRPYQIKLVQKTDLLDTGDPKEPNKNWVLLADYLDSTLLHNRIVLDLALELGLDETSHCQPVDLYYDGEYRGLYLLAEKVEVGVGRVEITDYEKILEQTNALVKSAPDLLTRIQRTNRFGDAFFATYGIRDGGEADLGGYLIELNKAYAFTEQAYFTLQSDPSADAYSIDNPEHVSEGMVRYLSELFEELYTAVANGGVPAQSGTGWDDYFDMDSLLPYYWVNEWSRNFDAWRYSSTYFTLPAQSRTFRMGPVWDFDLALYARVTEDGTLEGPTGLMAMKTKTSLDYRLLHIPAFQDLAMRYYLDVFEPVISQILLGDANTAGETLHSLTWYWEEEAASRRMNDVLWNPVLLVFGRVSAPTYEENYDLLRSFIRKRTAWLAEEVTHWSDPVKLETANITLTANFANAEDTLRAVVQGGDQDKLIVKQAYSLAKEATETEFALWRGDIALSAEIGYAFADDFALFINGAEIPYQKSNDRSISAIIWFEDITYRKALYNGMDYGLVFNPDYYAARYPEPAAALGYDRDALLAYYVENGIAAGQTANAYFDPREIPDTLPDVKAMLGEDYESIVFFFIEAGYEDWMSRLGRTYRPEVRAAE